jgi:hypothetical protein
MDLPCVVCGDPVSVLPEQEPRCGLCFDMPKTTRCAADPRMTDAEWDAWHAGAPSFAPLPGMEDAHRVRTEYFRLGSLRARNRLHSLGEWRAYQRATRDYADLSCDRVMQEWYGGEG